MSYYRCACISISLLPSIKSAHYGIFLKSTPLIYHPVAVSNRVCPNSRFFGFLPRSYEATSFVKAMYATKSCACSMLTSIYFTKIIALIHYLQFVETVQYLSWMCPFIDDLVSCSYVGLISETWSHSLVLPVPLVPSGNVKCCRNYKYFIQFQLFVFRTLFL